MSTSARLTATLLLVLTGSAPMTPAPGGANHLEGMSQDTTCVRGRTVRWTWTDGPTAGVTHEHVFRTDGRVTWRVLSGPQEGHTGDEEAYAAFAVSDQVCAVSYLAASGNTLTVVLNMTSGEMYGFASNAERWFPGRGTFAMIR